MKLIVCLLSFALSSLASPLFLGSQEILSDDKKVPGDNPLEYCDPSLSEYSLIVEHVNLVPNPPVAGEKLTIDAVGNFTERVEEGAYVALSVKLGYITLIKTRADLCEQMANVGKECPIEKGQLKVTKEVQMPDLIPNGKYTVLADVYNADDTSLTCMTATVEFNK